MKQGLILSLVLIFAISQTVSGKLVNPITENFIQLSDVTTNNATAARHGFLPKLDNTGTKYLRDDGTWQVVSGGGGSTNMTVNTFSGNGVSTTFTMSSNPSVKENTLVYLSGVYQNKSNYSVSGTTITFNTAPVSGTNNIEIMVGTVSGTSGGGGEVNTASNLGTGAGVFAQKSGVDLQFKSVSSTNNSISISSDASNVYLTQPVNYLKYSKSLSTVSGTASTTYANIPLLESDFLPSGLYQILFAGEFATSATTTGIGLRLVNGTGTISKVKIKWEAEQAAAGTDMFSQYSQKTTTDNVTSTAVVAANTLYTILGRGLFNMSASGTVRIEMRSEIAASNVALYPQSNYIIQRVQ